MLRPSSAFGGGNVAKFVDFDAFWEETKPEEAEPKRIKVFGEVIDLPTTLPARIMLKAMRYQEDQDRSFVERVDAWLDDLRLLVGADRVEAWLDKGIDVAKIAQLYARIIEMYTHDASGEDDEGNGENPGEGKKMARSSKTGR